MKFDQNQYPKELFSGTPKFMTTCDFTKIGTPKFIFCSKNGTAKKAHPVPVKWFTLYYFCWVETFCRNPLKFSVWANFRAIQWTILNRNSKRFRQASKLSFFNFTASSNASVLGHQNEIVTWLVIHCNSRFKLRSHDTCRFLKTVKVWWIGLLRSCENGAVFAGRFWKW